MRIHGVLILAALLAPPAAQAQEQERVGLSLGVLAGATGAFQNLDKAGTAWLVGGPFVGAVLDWSPSSIPGLAVLSQLTYTRHELQGSVTGAGSRVDLYSLGWDLGFIFVNTEKLSSSFFGGGGGLLIYDAASGASRLKPFSRLGLDARYRLSPRIGLYAQVTGLIYTISNFPPGSLLQGYDHHQGDASFGGGAVVRF